ncbi:hypothetical protein JRQ81_001113, partial [Phrynocephalus forsythii]
VKLYLQAEGPIQEEKRFGEIHNILDSKEKGLTGELYKLMVTDKDFLFKALQNKWSNEMILTEDDIRKMMKGIREIKLVKFRELERKVIFKWYRTLTQLAYMIKGFKPNWHCNNEPDQPNHQLSLSKGNISTSTLNVKCFQVLANLKRQMLRV